MALNTRTQEILDNLSPFARSTLIEKLVNRILFQEENEMVIGLLNILEKYGLERCDESEETLSTDFCQECEAPLVETHADGSWTNIPCNCEDS